MKSRDGKSQRSEEKKKEDHKRESLRRKKIQVREKVGKSRNTVVFQWFVAPEGRKVGSLKRRVRSQLARWEMQNCTPLWREAHCQNVQSTPGPDHFWKLRCRKSARCCGPKHIWKSKCTKHTSYRPLLEVEMLKKCTPLWREAHFEVKSAKNWQVRSFWTFRCAFAWQAQGIVHLVKSEQNVRVFVAFPKTMAGVEHLKRICKDAFSVAGAVQDTCSSEMLGGQGADFLRRVAFWSIKSSGLLRWFCVTGAALGVTWHHFFVAGAVV